MMNLNQEQRHTIVYMDDDPDDIQLLQEVVASLDQRHRIIGAANGEEGLALLERLQEQGVPPCLTVLDLNMPKLNGRETFLRLKAHAVFRHIPVVVFSTSNSDSDRSFFQADGVEYISKPVDFSVFAQVAKRLLRHCNAIQEGPLENKRPHKDAASV